MSDHSPRSLEIARNLVGGYRSGPLLLAVAAALDAEREACASVADAHAQQFNLEVAEAAAIIADEIRALGEIVPPEALEELGGEA